MKQSIHYDNVTHDGHIHWCDLEANSLATCEANAYREHAVQWAGDALSFAAIDILLLLALRPLARALTRGNPGEIVIRLPSRRFRFARHVAAGTAGR